jgi:hypothetical protein
MTTAVIVPLEQWRPVLGAEDYYEVSSVGRVRSLPRECRTWHGPVNRPGRMMSSYLSTPSGSRGKYRRMRLQAPGLDRRAGVHLLVCEAFHGPRPPGHEVRHLDGDSLNNCADNLAFGTKQENAQDTLRHGRNAKAKRTHCSRGHAFSEANTAMNGTTRRCRICARENQRQYRCRQQS